MKRLPLVTASRGDGNVHRISRITSDPCEQNTVAARMEQIRLLREFAETPDAQFCGFTPFQKMSVTHDGERWVIELEALSSE